MTRIKNWFVKTFTPRERIYLALIWLTCLLVGFGFLPKAAKGQEPDGHPTITVAAENRVQNNELGLCWWCCADMIGREHQITYLKGIAQRVMASGRNFNATDTNIAAWMKALGVPLQEGPRVRGKEAVQFLRERLDNGQPTIAGVTIQTNRGPEKHAVLVTYLSYAAQKWSDGSTDFVVKFIDPNKSGQVQVEPWARFWGRSDGRYWAFATAGQVQGAIQVGQGGDQGNPAKQDGASAKPGLAAKTVPPLNEAKLAQKPGQFPQNPQLNKSQMQFVPGFSVVTPHTPGLVGGHVKSNQDIKDGVQRPSDVLINNAFGEYYFAGYDYYAEFKQKVAEGKIQLPKK